MRSPFSLVGNSTEELTGTLFLLLATIWLRIRDGVPAQPKHRS
ncbi:hypothetical protein [Desmonostoc muscorum]|nr:hypothetical protein [Desmonostoc muscorum]